MATKPYRHKYGITLAQYEAMLEHQSGGCAICERPPAARRLSVDHDHKTGIIRGLLCDYCNRRVVGRHTAERLRDAAAYLLDPPAVHAIGTYIVPTRKRRKK